MTIKHDTEKLRPSLIPMESLKEVIKVLEFGAKKYSVDNWKTVPDGKQRYLDAALRHLMAVANGDVNDIESELPHMAHAICCGLFYLWFDNGGNHISLSDSDFEKMYTCPTPVFKVD